MCIACLIQSNLLTVNSLVSEVLSDVFMYKKKFITISVATVTSGKKQKMNNSFKEVVYHSNMRLAYMCRGCLLLR